MPPNQAYMIRDALKAKGVPVAYIEFAGEGHGFRRAENMIRAKEAELDFYGRVFGFTPADKIEPVEIENAAALGVPAQGRPRPPSRETGRAATECRASRPESQRRRSGRSAPSNTVPAGSLLRRIRDVGG